MFDIWAGTVTRECACGSQLSTPSADLLAHWRDKHAAHGGDVDAEPFAGPHLNCTFCAGHHRVADRRECCAAERAAFRAHYARPKVVG